jgi:putative acetyltransferase
MIKIETCTVNDPSYKGLITLLDKELCDIYSLDPEKFEKYNAISDMAATVVLYLNNEPVACGCYREYAPDTVELKRIFVKAEHRGKGISKKIISELEHLAGHSGYTRAVLETGNLQPVAINLYNTIGYTIIDNFGPYKNNHYSVCFAKSL